ncbi:hypothetical protein OSTOST_01107 [Ostertagia ostertagi]
MPESGDIDTPKLGKMPEMSRAMSHVVGIECKAGAEAKCVCLIPREATYGRKLIQGLMEDVPQRAAVTISGGSNGYDGAIFKTCTRDVIVVKMCASTECYHNNMRNLHLIWVLSLIIEAAFALHSMNEILTLNRLKRFYGLSPRARKEDQVEKVVNRHLLKQPFMKFDLLWKKFNGRKRSDPEFIVL